MDDLVRDLKDLSLDIKGGEHETKRLVKYIREVLERAERNIVGGGGQDVVNATKVLSPSGQADLKRWCECIFSLATPQVNLSC